MSDVEDLMNEIQLFWNRMVQTGTRLQTLAHVLMARKMVERFS